MGKYEELIFKEVDILGTPYTILYKNEDEALISETADGLCDDLKKEITVIVRKEDQNDPLYPSGKFAEKYRQRILRHEIMHAYLFESGLADDSTSPEDGWAVHEEMIDWFARMSPKIFKTYKELGICD